jgi:hypothetical protein
LSGPPHSDRFAIEETHLLFLDLRASDKMVLGRAVVLPGPETAIFGC